MKKTILFILTLLVSTGIVSAKSTIYCKFDGQVVDANTEDGRYDCSESLAFGEACFTGSRTEVIDLINNDDMFNWDEERLEKAHFNGRDAISYDYVDGPNDLREEHVLNRCTREFFRR